MSRHFWHACNRGAGFSFVELLVTIIIAGIAFAAMVPVFVQAQQVSSGEQMRNAALQLAQDKLEKVRGLDYDVITQANLQSGTFANGQFGTSVSWATGGGNTRTFNVSYQVDLIDSDGGAGATAGEEAYKQVTITASWTGGPSPVKPAQLSTMISQQYAGPQIVRFDIGPDGVLDEVGGSWTIISGPVVLDAFISPDDIMSMNQAADEADKGYVQFTVTSLVGTEVASSKITAPVSGEPAHYQFTWDNSAATDGVYVFQAVAVAGFGSRAQGTPVSLALNYANHAPPAPTNLAALPGDGIVYLTWTAPSVGDLHHYEVWRSENATDFVKLAEADTAIFNNSEAIVVDEVTYSVVNGTQYYYKVRSIDTEGYAGPFSAVVSATPNPATDVVAPSIPSPLTATADPAQPTVHLVWTASVDGGDPTSGLGGYVVERSANGVDEWTVLQSLYESTDYDDTTAGWSSTWWYRVSAVDLAGNASGYASAGPVTTIAPILRSITVTNNSSIQTYVWVQNAATLTWYGQTGTESATRPSSGVWVKKNNNSKTWTNLPSGIYNVFFLSSSGWNGSNIKKTLAVNVNGGNGTAYYP